MKKYLLLLLLIVSTYFPLKAQMNLVPNPSFEDVLFCPNSLGQIYLATPWENYGISPDLFCACSPNGISVPNNFLNYQFAKSGNCIAGLITYRRPNSPNGPNAREYIGTQLTNPLVTGLKYYFSCYINFAFSQSTNVASNKFGVKFLLSDYDSSQSQLLTTNDAMIYSDSLLSDTLSWFKIHGSFIADSSYTHIVLGNFFTDTQTDTLSFAPFPPPDQSYYFLDDICLSTDSLYCENWTSIQAIPDNSSKLILYPNPVLSNLNITAETGIKSIAVKNVFGRQLLFYEGITETSTILNLEEMPSGIYLVEIDFGESILNRKIIKL